MTLRKNIGGRSQASPTAIWAVDLFAADLRLQHEAAAAIQLLQRRTGMRVRPVYLSPPSPRSQPSFRQWAQGRLDELAASVGIPPGSLLPVEIVESPEPSVSARVSALLAFAHERGVGLIFVSTRARRGPARWFLGSFTDTLSLQSDIPLFVVNPSWKEADDFEEILFPTDFSKRARETYPRILRFASQADLAVCVFHKYGSSIGPSWDFNLVPSPTLTEAGNDEIAEIRRELEKWRKKGGEAGVRTTVELDADSGTVAESILRRAELTACVLAMTARRTRIEAVMLGSITRQLIRESAAPIWILCEPRAERLEQLGGQLGA